MKQLHVHFSTYNSYVAVLEALKQPISRKEIAEKTNISLKEVDNRLRILSNIGAIEKIVYSPKNVRYRLIENVQLIQSHGNNAIESKVEGNLFYGRKKRREIIKDLNINDRVRIITSYGKTEERAKTNVITGKVIDIKNDFFLIQTKNYKECFSWYELGRVVFKI